MGTKQKVKSQCVAGTKVQNVIFAHGKPSRERYENPELPKSHEANWFPWAKAQLEERGIRADVPAMPAPYYPIYPWWKIAFLQYPITSETGLVGFSAGAEFMLRLLSEDPSLTPERVVLVAPWTDRGRKYGDFSNFETDRGIGKRVGQLTIITSADDRSDILVNAGLIQSQIPEAGIVQLKGYGHFMIGNNMTGPEFPELIDELVVT
jgi:hypothetical protein